MKYLVIKYLNKKISGMNNKARKIIKDIVWAIGRIVSLCCENIR